MVEILETVPVDNEVVNACQRLKEAGYLIALDDYVSNDPREPLAEMADILKVDLKLTTHEQRAALIKKHGPWRCRMLAEKVESHSRVRCRQRAGIHLFPRIFLAAAGNDDHARRARQRNQLHENVAGGFAAEIDVAEVEK